MTIVAGFPPLSTDGPFLNFLRIDFEQGLETIARLIDFASERWQHYKAIDARQYEEEKRNHGDEADPFDHLVRQWRQPPGTVILPLDQGERELIGDERAYGWSAGHNNPPRAWK